MRYQVTVKRTADGRWYARCPSTPVGMCEATGDSREEVLERLRLEIRYRLEWCPCSGVADDFVELDIAETSAPRWHSA